MPHANSLLAVSCALFFSWPGEARLVAATEAATTFQPRFTRISTDEGLSHVDVRAVAQDHDGFMWFGTTFGGLNRYDGYEIKSYLHNDNAPGTIGHNYVWALLVDQTGTLWAGTNGGGLDRYDRRTDTFVSFRADAQKPGSLPSDIVLSLYEDRAGTLWVGTRGGLSRMDRERGTFKTYAQPGGSSSDSINSVRTIMEDTATGLLWLGTSEGLIAFDPRTEQSLTFLGTGTRVAGKSENSINELIKDDEGIFWILTEAGLVSFVPEVREISRGQREPLYTTFKRFNAQPGDPHSLSHDAVRGGLLDSKGRLWLGTTDGLNLFDRKSGRSLQLRNMPGDPTSLSDNTVNKVFQDRDGGIWVVTRYNGVNRLKSEDKPFFVYQHDPNNPNSLGPGAVTAVFVDRSDRLWVGTSGGLSRFDGSNWTRFSHKPGDPSSLSGNAISVLGEDSSGALWVGTYDAGLNRFDGRAFQRFLHTAAGPETTSGPRTYTGGRIAGVLADPRGGLWIGAREYGLDHYDGKLFHRHPPMSPDGKRLPTEGPKFGFVDAEGALWYGAENSGLVRHDPATGSFTVYSLEHTDANKNIYNVTPDGRGSLWVSSMSGLFRFDLAKRRFVRRYTAVDGLPTDVIADILIDRGGLFWVSTQKGITRFDPSNGTFRTYDRSDGLPTSQFTVLTASQASDGRCYFGSGTSVTAFYPRELRDNPRPPKIVLTGFELFDQPVEPRPTGSPLQEDIAVARSITLRHDQSVFSFRFAALDFTAPEKNRYVFKMEGFDSSWRAATARNRRVTYTNLAPGRYTFYVRGSNNDGVWSLHDRIIAIQILPPWWGTAWFRAAVGLAAAALVVGGYRWRVGAIKLRARELAEEVDERTLELQHEVEERKRAEVALLQSNTELENRVLERTSELAHANATLRTSEERYRALYEDNPAMYFTLDPSATVLSVNRFGAEQLGYAVEDLVGRSILKFFHPDDANTFSRQVESCLQNIGQLARWELRKVRRDGSVFWVKELARAVRQADGRLVVLVACEDITSKVNLEAQLRQVQKMEALGQLAGGVAHDFNNLLTVILGQAESLDEPSLDLSERRTSVHEIKEAARRATNLTRQLLLFSRGQAMNRVPQDLGDIVNGVAKMLKRLIGENIELRAEVPPGSSPLLADAGMIEQVLVNMAVNARDAMPGGGQLLLRNRTVSLTPEMRKAHPEAAPGDYLCLEVTDTGGGISEDVIPRIFEPFFTTKEIGRGTGLGLATSLGIIQQHQGWIDVVSAKGVGTTFRIYLPRLAERVQTQPSPASPPPPRGNETILLVEDEPSVRRSVRSVLEKHGYRVHEAGNGDEALVVWERHRDEIQLLLSDIVMPGTLSGRALASKLVAAKPGLKVALMSGYDPGVLAGEEESSLTQFAPPLLKPPSMQDLLQFVRKQLGS
jgi:PAS domain S-box-containing protein